ncbi:MAG: hypothetical protein L0H38_00970 [bacterium]|nr:hypothetical protein [bacterium]
MSASENDAAFDDIANNYDKTADPSQENDNIKKARDKEENFSSNVSSKNAGNKGKLNLKGFFKKNSKNGILPSSVVLISLITGIFGIGGLGLNSLMLVHLKENFTSKFDTQNTSMQIRSERLWNKKLLGESTKGDCKVTKILCRYSKPSNHMLKQLAKNGIIAVDAKGNKVKTNKLWPNKRPASYVYRDGSKGLVEVDAKNFSKELKNNPILRSAFRLAYNPRWVGYADSAFKAVSKKFSIAKNVGKNLNAKNKNDLKKRLGSGNGGREGAIDKKGGVKAIDKVATKQMSKIATNLEAAGKGGATVAIVSAACIVSDLPSLFSTMSRGLQAAQLVQYSFPFLSVADSIKYGDGNEKDIGLLGDLLTTQVDGKSGMDSYGIKYALLDDTKPDNDDYKKFSAGSSGKELVADNLDIFLGGDIRRELCQTATSPAGAATIAGIRGAFVAGTLGGGLAAAAIDYGAGAAIGAAIKLFGGGAIKLFLAVIPDSFKESMLKFMIGDLTKDLAGAPVGNALGGGIPLMMGETASIGGNVPMSVDQAVAYKKTTDQVELAYAEEVRATHSPFDASTKYTFMGSIVDSMLPYFGKINNVNNVLSTIGNITARSLGSIFNVSAAGNSKAEYKMCDIPSIRDSDIAAGPFCNIFYGIPSSELSRDPDDVVDYMLKTDNIDEEGKTIDGSDYEKWLGLCANGDPDLPALCQIKGDVKEENANFAVFTVDNRVQKSMDDPEETKPDTGSPGDSGDSGDTGGTVDGSTQELAQKILDLHKKGKITFQFTTLNVIKALADGKKAPVNGTNTSVKSTDVEPKLLQFLVDLVETVDKEKGKKTEINVLTNQTHSATSNHYKGKAVDLGCNIMDYTSIADKIGKKYGILRNPGESCAQSAGHHLHYSTTGK